MIWYAVEVMLLYSHAPHSLFLQEKAIMMRLATEKAEISRLRLKARGLSERKRKAAMTAQIDAVVDVDISEQRRKSERKANVGHMRLFVS